MAQDKKGDKKYDFVNPLAVAHGAGSSHEGTHHWLHERLTGIAATPLMVWLAWSVVRFGTLDYASFIAWQAELVNAVLMILSVIAVFYHTALGVQSVVEDYVHQPAVKIVTLAAVNLFLFAAALACIFSILKIAFAG